MADEFCLKMPDFHMTFRDLFHAINLRHETNGFSSLPKEGVLRIFFALKNPRTWVPKASTLPLDHRSRLNARSEVFRFLIKYHIKTNGKRTGHCGIRWSWMIGARCVRFTSKEAITLQLNGSDFILRQAPNLEGDLGSNSGKVFLIRFLLYFSQPLLTNSWTVTMIQLRPFISTTFPIHYFVILPLLDTN